MEKLLNIKEAAELLNVSEMTLRRWTNSGRLRCYRIGGKNERRFKLGDIREFIEKGNSVKSPASMSPGIDGLKIQAGSHFTHLSSGIREGRDVAAAYIAEALADGATVLLVAPEDERERHLNALLEKGINVGDVRQQGILLVSTGKNNPREMAEFISHTASSTKRPFRLFGDMTWTIRKGWSLSDIRELEDIANRSLHKDEVIYLCQYPLEYFSGEAAMMACETHGHILYKGYLMESPFFTQTTLKGEPW